MSADLGAVIVTGAGGGIGSALVRQLVGQGWHVQGVDLVQPNHSMSTLGDRLDWIVGDVRDEDVVSGAVTAAGQLGPLRGLVTATIAEDRAPLEDLDRARIAAVLEATVETAWSWSAALVAASREDGASLVHISSVHAVRASGGMAAYAMAKAALGGLVRASALEWGPRGVRCNAVLPGFVPVGRNAHRWSDPAVAASIISHHPLGRLVTPDDVASAAAFLLGPGAAGITGVSLPVDGGMLAMLPGWA